MRLNGKYYGKFAFSDIWNEDSLADNGYSVTPDALLWKSESGEYSNLRWDIPPDQVQYYYSLEEGEQGAAGAAKLVELGKGLAGGASLPRSKFLFDAINLPKVRTCVGSGEGFCLRGRQMQAGSLSGCKAQGVQATSADVTSDHTCHDRRRQFLPRSTRMHAKTPLLCINH